ncbi:MAG: DNA repair exonuclease [Candidatus Eisenbacteria bacterium]|uniref:DNA repair exonuclease n=1 Tax=Eiseniibacteriota bacterium TaxID=2212470 RepID=A0A948RXR6_UNCEI|nr:DNA repair exonuclease [Candidatus Eisenbacteria bacterium]MBU1947664.1 DNA repair exonuclease [Candidatus Eisenbacteria bacterium]MBU2690184.1 DNA repair exonuclease [Candidatus Eisenbacteria bacterium]
MGRKILHLADLHLGYKPHTLGDGAGLHQQQRDTLLTRIVSWVLEEARDEVGLLLIVGDLFESPHPAPGLVESVIRELSRLVAAGIQVITIPGNHDELTYTDGVYRTHADRWPGRLVTHPRPHEVMVLEWDKVVVAVHSMAYIQSESPDSPVFPPVSGKDVFHIAAVHATLTDRLGGFIAEGDRALKVRFDDLSQKGFSYVALGHIHNGPLEWTTAGAAAAYAGAIEGKSYHDPGGAGLLLVDPSSRPPVLERRPINRHIIRNGIISLHEVQDESALERRILEWAGHNLQAEKYPRLTDFKGEVDFSSMALRIRLQGHAGFVLDIERIQARLAPRFLALEIRVEDPAWDLGDWTRWKNEETLRGAVVRTAMEKIGAAAHEEERRFLTEAAAVALRALHVATQEGNVTR